MDRINELINEIAHEAVCNNHREARLRATVELNLTDTIFRFWDYNKQNKTIEMIGSLRVENLFLERMTDTQEEELISNLEEIRARLFKDEITMYFLSTLDKVTKGYSPKKQA